MLWGVPDFRGRFQWGRYRLCKGVRLVRRFPARRVHCRSAPPPSSTCSGAWCLQQRWRASLENVIFLSAEIGRFKAVEVSKMTVSHSYAQPDSKTVSLRGETQAPNAYTARVIQKSGLEEVWKRFPAEPEASNLSARPNAACSIYRSRLDESSSHVSVEGECWMGRNILSWRKIAQRLRASVRTARRPIELPVVTKAQ